MKFIVDWFFSLILTFYHVLLLSLPDIYVPPSQVIDTVNLYHSPSHPRKLSLRFLSWFLLKQAIQAGGEEQGHDSIEDARAALQLYRLWEGFKKAGRTEDVLEDLYEEGRRVVSVSRPIGVDVLIF